MIYWITIGLIMSMAPFALLFLHSVAAGLTELFPTLLNSKPWIR